MTNERSAIVSLSTFRENRLRPFVLASLASLVVISSVSCNKPSDSNSDSDATTFIARAERVLDSLNTRSQRATWVQENFITDDTEILNAQASRDLAVAVQQLAMQA